MADDPYTLVVALDAAGTAAGELYLDDGRSFAFERGVFSHRALSFQGGVLRNADAAAAGLPVPSGKPGKYASDVVVERIIVLGLEGSPARWQVAVGGRKLEAAPGPLVLRPGAPGAALVVRKPGLAINEDWSLEFSKL